MSLGTMVLKILILMFDMFNKIKMSELEIQFDLITFYSFQFLT